MSWAAAMLCAALGLEGCAKASSGESPETLVKDAWAAFRLEEFAAADKGFREALANLDRKKGAETAADRRLRLNAMYGRGLVASLGREGQQRDIARQSFEQVESLDPGGEMGAWAALAIVRDAHVHGGAAGHLDLTGLQAGYSRVIERFAQSAAAEEAFTYRESLLVETFSADDARQAVSDLESHLLENGPAKSGKLRTTLYGLLSQAHETLKEYPQALQAAIASLEAKENDPANPNQNNIIEYYRIAVMAQFDVGDFATARSYYQRFLREYPRDQRAFTVTLLLEHLDDTEARLRRGQPVAELSRLSQARPVEAGR